MSTASLRSRPEGFHTGSSRQNMFQRAKRVVQYRRILDLLVRRDLKVRYAGSALGYLWTVLDPLLMSLVYWFVFTKILKRDAGPQNRPFMLYLVTGQLIWGWFNGGVVAAAKAIRAEAQMVRSSNVPRELWVVRIAVSKGIEYLFGLPVVAIYALAYAKKPTLGVLLLPLAALLAFLLVLGIGLILAPLTVLVRDIDRIIPIVMRVLFYCSPILYSVRQVPTPVRVIYNWNPAVGMLDLARATFFPVDLNWVNVLHSAIVTLILLVIGSWVFARLERPVLKEI
jgi:ABC-2 type transport system permease protein